MKAGGLGVLLRLGWSTTKADWERIWAPILMASTLLVLFTFAFGDLPEGIKHEVFAGEVALVMLFSLQLAYGRALEADWEDDAFRYLLMSRIRPEMIFWAKVILVIAWTALIVTPTLLLVGLFFGLGISELALLWGLMVAAAAGMGACGVLLAALTRRAKGRDVVFAILYYPLVIPVLVSLIMLIRSGGEGPSVGPWLAMLFGFDTVYMALGAVLFALLFEPT